MKNSIIRVAISTLLILLVLLVMTLLRPDDWDWNLTDFIIIGSLLFGTGIGYEFIASKIKESKNRILVGIAITAIVMLISIDLAVGIFGFPWSGS